MADLPKKRRYSLSPQEFQGVPRDELLNLDEADVPKKKLTLKKMPSGAQQYTRGDTPTERMETLIDAGTGASLQRQRLEKDITFREDPDVLKKKISKKNEADKGFTKLTDAFLDEHDASTTETGYKKGGIVTAKRSSKRGCGIAVKGFGRAGGR